MALIDAHGARGGHRNHAAVSLFAVAGFQVGHHYRVGEFFGGGYWLAHRLRHLTGFGVRHHHRVRNGAFLGHGLHHTVLNRASGGLRNHDRALVSDGAHFGNHLCGGDDFFPRLLAVHGDHYFFRRGGPLGNHHGLGHGGARLRCCTRCRGTGGTIASGATTRVAGRATSADAASFAKQVPKRSCFGVVCQTHKSQGNYANYQFSPHFRIHPVFWLKWIGLHVCPR